MHYLTYFYRRFLSLLIGIGQSPLRLSVFGVLFLVALVVSWVGYRDRDDGEPIGGHILANSI